MAIKKGTLDELLSGRDPKEVFSKDGLFDELKKALAERVLNAELDDHLDGHAAAGKANHRNGYSKKTVLTENAKLDLRIPRDREGSALTAAASTNAITLEWLFRPTPTPLQNCPSGPMIIANSTRTSA
jgi:transposase-like protein